MRKYRILKRSLIGAAIAAVLLAVSAPGAVQAKEGAEKSEHTGVKSTYEERISEMRPESDFDDVQLTSSDTDGSLELTPVGDPTDITDYITVNDSGVITAYSRNDIADIVIPSSKNGVTIKEINGYVFQNHTEIESVIFPETLKLIGRNAFCGVSFGTNHTTGNLVIPSSVDTIGRNAFSGCNYLGTVTFEDYTGSGEIVSISFPDYWAGDSDSFVFNNCAKLKKITLSNKITRIPGNFASDNPSLEVVEWSPNLKSIGRYAFNGDSSLKTSDLSQTKLEEIEEHAFSGCSNFPGVAFPDTLRSIGGYAFHKTAMGSNMGLHNLVIPSNVETVGDTAFSECAYLGSVIFEDDETAGSLVLERSMFLNDQKLSRIVLSDSVSTIPENFADGAVNLETVEWSDNLTSIGDCAFKGCSKLAFSSFPKTLKTIGSYSFNDAGTDTKGKTGDIVIPSSVESIGSYAFQGCTYLNSISFEDYDGEGEPFSINFQLGISGSYAFSGCKGLKRIRLSNQVQTIPAYFAPGATRLETVEWPDELTSIGNNAFEKDSMLVSSDLSHTKLTTIGNAAFFGCSMLPAVKFPDTLTEIGTSAFGGASMGIISQGGTVVIPSSVEIVGAYAFSDCPYLRKIVIGKDNGLIDGMDLGIYTFYRCSYLTEIELSGRIRKIPQYCADGSNSLSHLIVTDNLEEIGNNSFRVYPEFGIVVNPLTDVVKNYDWTADNRKLVDSAVVDVALDKAELSLEAGSNAVLTATTATYPTTAAQPTLVWTSDKEAVATVSNTGKVTGKSEGTATITAATEDGRVKAGCIVTVTGSSVSTFTVTFNTNGGSAVDSQTVIENGKAVKPETDPQKEGFNFGGWYADEGLTQPFDFNTSITKDTEIFAKWISKSTTTYTVTFNTNGGSKVEPQAVEKNGKVSKPADPTRDGYTFDGWYEDSALKTKYDFNKPVTGELTLYAKWSEKAEAKEFTLQRDNNHFSNSRIDFLGSYSTSGTYQFKNDANYEKLRKIAKEKYDIPRLDRLVWSEWGGSCYGIATTMALALTGRINAGDLTNGSVSSYHDLSKPYADDVLFDSINFYQSGQLMSAMYDDALIADASEGLESFLKALVDNTSDGSPVIFSYGYSAGGHAILALKSEKQSDGSYKVTMYDENTASGSTETEHFTYLTVEKDYSDFDYTIVGERKKLQEEYTRLAIRDPYKYPLFTEIDSAVGTPLYVTSAGSEKVLIDLPWDANEIILVNGENKNLSIKGGETGGDMKVYDAQYVYADDASRVMVTVDRSDLFTLSSNVLDASIITDKKILGINAEKAEKATFSLSEGNESIEIEGNSYSFDAQISSGDSEVVLSIKADATGKNIVSVDGSTIKASTDGTIKGISSTTYTGNDSKEEKVEASDDGKEIWAKHEERAARSGLDPEPMLTSDSSLYMVKGQAFTLGDGSWSLVGNTKTVALAKKKGAWTLTAKKAGQDSVTNGTVTYKVFVSEPKVIFPDGKKKVKLVIGGIATAKVDGIQGDLISKYPITWVSDKLQVVTLSGNILGATTVNAVGKGSAKVTAYIDGKAYTCNVSVTDDGKNIPKTVSGTGVVAINPMQSVSLKYSGFNPKGAKWESTDSSNPMKDAEQNKKGETVSVSNGIVMVNTANGKLTAVGEGETTILGTDTSGSKVTLKVTVKAIPSNPVVYLRAGKSAKLSAPKLNGKNAEWKALRGNEWIQGVTEGKVTAASSLPVKASSDFAEVSSVFKPSAYGNGFNYLYKVYVEEPDLVADSSGNGLKAGAKAGQYTLTLEGGEKYDLSKCYTGIKQPFIWKTSKGAVAYVDEYGTVHANRSGVKGTTKLTAKVNGKSLTVNVTVN